MGDKKLIIQHGAQSQTNVNSGEGTMIINNNYLQGRSWVEASSDLRSWYSCVYGEKHIERIETERLWNWIVRWDNVIKPMDRVSLLVGDAGTGKSVVMHDLLLKLEQSGMKTLGLKSDILFASDTDLDKVVGLGKSVSSIILELAQKEKVILLVDQIDALSSTLSANRKPLHSINTLVSEVCVSPNVRVVVSCRPYDQQYDPMLDRYRDRNVVTMGGLPIEEVNNTLNLAGIKIEADEELIKNFLANPLNLYLFCKVKNGNVFVGKKPSRTLLYDALWKQIVVEKSKESSLFDVKSLTSCLDFVSSKMYESQSLALPTAIIETYYPNEMSYLESNSLLVSIAGSNHLQFMHQSFYDYVYARLFYSKGLTIDDILNGIHQGLFIRLRLKQVLFYLRDNDEDAYIRNLDLLLYAEEMGISKYRYHLKHLMLSNLGFLEELSIKEKHYIESNILNNADYAEVYIDSINKWAGLSLYISKVNKQGGFASLSEERQLQLINACDRVISVNTIESLTYLNSIDFTTVSSTIKSAMWNVANRLPIADSFIEQILQLIEKIDEEDDSIHMEHLLVRLLPYVPEFVGKKLVDYVATIVSTIKGDFSSHDIRMGYEVDYILDEIKKQCPSIAFDIILQMVELIGRKSVSELQHDLPIMSSRVFYPYQRGNEYGNFTDKLLTYLIDQAEINAHEDNFDFKNRLQTFANSDLAPIVLIAVCAYCKNIDQYIPDAFLLSKRIITSEHNSTVLDYYAKEMFKVMFPLLSREQKNEVMKLLEVLSPQWETSSTKDKNVNRPFSYMGYTRAQYYSMLTDDELSFYPEAFKFRNEKLRVFKTLENHEPFKTSFKAGWTTIKSEWYASFTVPELVKTMLEITNNFSTNWDAPTKTGHAIAIKQHIANRADDIYEAYLRALDNPALDLDYPLYGIEAFIEISYPKERIDALVCKILSRLNGKLNSFTPSHIIQTCRIVDRYYDGGLIIPDSLFSFVCRVAKDWDDSDYKTEECQSMSYNDGINQVRGCAAEVLLRCYNEPERYDLIFETLYSVSENGAISTRSAVLFRLGALMRAGKEKCLKLFLQMTRDYSTSLLNLPVHDLNPILYLMSDFFEELKPYFEACIQNEATHKVNVYILWIAWVRNLKGAEELMYRMADASLAGRSGLLKNIEQHCSQHLDNILPILYRYLNFDEQESASFYDYYFNNNIQKWPNKMRIHFVDRFVESSASKYCSHYFIEYLQKESVNDPENILRWLPFVYERKGTENTWTCSPSKLIDILLSAYNSIVMFDKDNPILEKALDLLDEWLHNNDNRKYMYNCFKLLEE